MSLVQILWSVFLVVVIIAIWLTTQFVVVPYLRLQQRRKVSQGHTPQPEEIWVQDDGILYIDAVSASGVELMTFDPKAGTINRWKDTWPEWQQRLVLRTVYFTGQRRPLGPG